MKLKKTYETPASETLELKMNSVLLQGSNLLFLYSLLGEDLDGTLDDYEGDSESKWF